MSCSYVPLDKDFLSTPRTNVVVLGTVVVDEEQIYLEGADQFRLLLELPDTTDPAKFAQYEDRVLLIMGAINESALAMKWHAAFKTPPSLSMFHEVERKMEAYPALFAAETEREV